MKKYLKYNVFIIALFVLFMVNVSATNYSSSDIPDYSYVIGSHIFTDDEDQTEFYKGFVGTPQVMLGSSSIDFSDAESLDDFVIYYHLVSTLWTNSIDGSLIEDVPENFEITHINGTCIDEEKCGEEVGTKHTVTFTSHDKISFPFEDKEVSVTHKDTIAASDIPTDLTRYGYKFVCWYEDSEENSGADCFQFDTPITKDLTLKTKWEAIKYTIKYNLNGVEGSVEDQECDLSTINNTCQFATYDVPRNGYEFKGWSLIKDSQNLYYKSGTTMTDILKETSEITLYAVWEPINYKITYDLDGGTYTNDINPVITYNIENKEEIKLFKPTKKGYKFTGWNVEESTGSGSITGDTDSGYKLNVSSVGEIIIKAQWEEIQIEFSFKLGDEVDGVTPGNVTCKYETGCTLAEAPEREGYLFGGWEDKETTFLYAASQTIKHFDFEANDNVTLTAVWFKEKEDRYHIIYDLNDGFFNQTPVSEFTADTTDTSFATPTRIGYQFMGWCKEDPEPDAESCDTVTKVSDIITDPKQPDALKDVNVYALWKANEYTITFHKNDEGNTEIGDKITCTYDKNCALTDHSALFTTDDEGRQIALIGWAYKPSTGIYVSDNIEVKNLATEGEVKLYAVTKDITEDYKITYYLDGGTFKDHLEPQKTITKGDQLTLPELETREGYTFDGWYTLDENGLIKEEKLGDPNVQVDITADTTLIAKWTKDITYKITYYLNGGTFKSAESVKYEIPANGQLTLPEMAELPGYVFDGWYKLEASGTLGEKAGEVNTEITIAEDTVLVAKWTPVVTYKIDYYLAGGKFEELKYHPESGQSTYDPVTYPKIGNDQAEITIPNPHKNGYEFTGWQDAQTEEPIGEDTIDHKGKTITLTKDLFLVATWQERPEPTIATNFPETMKTNEAFDFKVTNQVGKDEGTFVIAKVTFTHKNSGSGAKNELSELKYCAIYNEDGTTCQTWLNFRPEDWEGDSIVYFGPQTTGFPLYDLTSLFNVTFNQADEYKIKIEMLKWDNDFEKTKSTNEVLSTTEIDITVASE